MTCKPFKIKTDYYVPEEDEISKFGVDQTVICKEDLLKYIARYKKYQLRTHYSDSSISEWYPFVNSYYPYTEDVDAFARVSHLLGSKPSFASLSSAEDAALFRPVEEKIPYSESGAQNHYMRSRPCSFIILGKPEIGEKELGQILAEQWDCVYINPEILIEQEVFSGSRAGQCIEFNLRSGRAIGIDVVLRLVEKRTKSESAKHRGFVICGLPLIPNDLYKEDPISSESAVFTAREIFEEIFDLAERLIPEPPTKPPASRASKYKPDEEEEEEEMKGEFGEEEMEEPKPMKTSAFVPIDIPIDVGPDFDVCEKPEIGTNYEDQLNFIFDLLKPPFIIIYIMCSSADVIEKRRNYRFEMNSKQIISLQTELHNNILYNFYAQQDNINDELFRDFLEANYLDIDMNRLHYMIRLPRHFPANVTPQLEAYHYTGLHFIERRVLMHDPQYFLKVDGRVSIKRMFRIVRSRLNILPLQQVVVPTRLFNEPLDLGEGATQEETNLDNVYSELSRSQVPSTIFKWNWSDWGVKCPVALYEGTLEDGDPKYAVHFMNKMFFLSSEENFLKFYRNPRPFLLPPNPKPPCKVFVFGPRKSGKSAVAHCLGFLLDGTVQSFSDILALYLMNEEEELLEKIKQEALKRAMELLNEIRIAEAKELENERIEKIKEWARSTKRLIEEMIVVMTELAQEEKVTTFEISSFPMAMKRESLLESERPLVLEYVKLREQFVALHIPISLKIEDWHAMLTDKRRLLIYLPTPLRSRPAVIPASPSDEFVQDYIKKAIADADLEDTSISNKRLAKTIFSRIKAVEDKHKEEGRVVGWVIDGMLCDLSILDEMYPDYMPYEVVTLMDEDDGSFLVDRFEADVDTDFTEFREFFLEIGQIDTAWKTPAYIPKKPCAQRIVQEILSDLINDPAYFDYMDEGPEDRTKEYRRQIEGFNQTWEDIKKYFLDHDIEPIEVKLTNKSLPELMCEVIEKLLDRYRVGASLFTELDRAEEVKNFGNQMLQKNISEGADTGADEDAFEKNRRYGDTHNFCPVTFHDKWVLWKGKEEFAVKFQNNLYLLCCEEDMNKFLESPRKYITGEAPEVLPPPRICVIGVPGVGKTTVSKALADNYGLVHVSFEDVLKKSLSVSLPQSLDELRRNENANANLNAYLNLDVLLPEGILHDAMSKIWFEHRTVGFVLDDFPKRPSDVKLMTDFRFIPDVIIYLTNDIVQIKEKLVKEQLELWEIEVNKQRELAENENKIQRQDWEARRKVRFEQLIEERRAQRYAMKMQHRETEGKPSAERPYMEDLKEEEEEEEEEEREAEYGKKMQAESQISFDSVADQDDVNEVNRLLDKELPEPVLEDISETTEEVMDRFETIAIDTINVESSFLQTIVGLCAADEIPIVDVIARFDYPELTIRHAFYISDKFKFRTRSHFERCYDVTMEVAERLLTCGYFFLSKFGKTCPVQYHEDKIPVQMYAPMEARNNVFPVLHRSYIYFIVGKENQAKFKEDPFKYISVEIFNFPLITFRIGVTGPPKSGKTVLATRIANEYGFKLITRGEAARYVLTYLPLSDLAQTMESVLRQGWEMTDEMVVKCVEAAAFDSKAVTQGIVLDGFPNTITEARHLSYTGHVPHLVIDLQATREEVFECLSFDVGRRGLPRYSKKFIGHLLEEWIMGAETFRTWFDREYQVMTKISISTSNWSVWYQAWKYITAVLFEIRHYFVHAADDWPLRLANMQVTPLEFLERQGAYKTYCPCCLHYTNDLMNGGEPPDRTGLVQYRYHFYWICPKHIEKFLKHPDIFMVPYNNHMLPQMLPIVVHPTSIPDNVFEEGVCVVCYKNKRVYIKGDILFAIEYINRVYLFDCKECFSLFLRSPTKFMCDINFKPPDNYPPLLYEELPVMGMLEQYVIKSVTRSLSFVARHRPVIPGLDIKTSAAICMGLYLKQMNPEIPEEYRPLYKEADDLYHQRRKKLLSYLQKMKSVINPYLYYENPIPDFEVPDTIEPESTESVVTAVTKIVDELVYNLDYDD